MNFVFKAIVKTCFFKSIVDSRVKKILSNRIKHDFYVISAQIKLLPLTFKIFVRCICKTTSLMFIISVYSTEKSK